VGETLGSGLGEITSLAALLERHCEALEADLARYYRVDLRDLWRGGGALTYRRLQVLLDHLPPESATMTALREEFTDDELSAMAKNAEPSGHGPWSHPDLLLAGISDRLDWVIWAIFAVQGGKGDRPTPMPRPGVGPAVPALDDLTLTRLRRLRSREVA
jgi:hypothetical protein